MRNLAGKRESSSIDEPTDVVMIGKNGVNCEVKNEKVGLKGAKMESILCSSWGLFLKERVPSFAFNIANLQKSTTNKLHTDTTLVEQAKLFILSLETVNKRLDKSLVKDQSKTREINTAVIKCEQEIAQMERRIVSEGGGIKLLTELSFNLNSQLCKIEPAVDSIYEVKKQISKNLVFCEGLRTSIVDASMKMEELVKVKQNRKLLNLELEKKTAAMVAKSSAHLIRDEYKVQEELSLVSKNIIELKVVTDRLRNNLQRQLRKRDKEIENVKSIQECVRTFSKEREGAKRNIAILKAARNAANKKLASLKKDISIRARQNVIIEPSFKQSVLEGEDMVVSSEDVAKITDIKTLERVIFDLCQKNKNLKKDLSKTTSRVLNLMVTLSTIGDTSNRW